MKSRLMQILTYVFMIAILLVIVTLNIKTESVFVNILRYVSFGIVFLVGSIVIYIAIYCIIDNKKVGKLLDTDNYDELLIHCNKKIKRKSILLKDRKNYYLYLRILCYLELDDDKNIQEAYNVFDASDNYPATLYWRACYDFQKGRYDYIKEYYDYFNSTPQSKKPVYDNQYKVFEMLIAYIDNDIDKLKQKYEEVDKTKISIPASLRMLDIIKAKIDENTPIDVIDDKQE